MSVRVTSFAFFFASRAFLLCSASFFAAAILPGFFGTVCFVVVVICSESASFFSELV